MLSSASSNSPSSIIKEDEETAQKENMSSLIERYKDRVSTLSKQKDWVYLYNYEGFWFQSNTHFSVETIMALQDDFRAQPTDVFLISYPKSGTTWLKALVFAIVNRTKFKNSTGSSPTHPLLTTSPHDCIPFIETESFLSNPCYADGLISTHIPYTLLPKSIISAGCRIVYICRNPKDVFISFWHFMNNLRDDLSPPMKLEDAFELFSKGVSQYGPCWEHVIGYRKASLERPDKVLFLKYEDMKKDAKNDIKKLAEFIGYPFTEEEEAAGAVQEIIELCSFNKLNKAIKANKDGEEIPKLTPKDLIYREGKVGDSANYLTTKMIQILDGITREKYDGLDILF